MSSITARTEGSTGCFLFTPFQIGMRHLRVATCDGKQDTLITLAKERNIYRPSAYAKKYQELTTETRVFHAVLGLAETAGYLTVVLPVIATIAEKILAPWYHKGWYGAYTHYQEGGKEKERPMRKNPFDRNGIEDPFYKGASWIENAKKSPSKIPETHNHLLQMLLFTSMGVLGALGTIIVRALSWQPLIGKHPSK
ncbi:MAG: hypothetical protein V4494_00995 [Chlamydiota bacterium]